MKTTIRDIVIREVRRREISGYRLARLSGVAERTVYGFLGGEADITSAKLGAILDSLDLEIRPKVKTTKTSTKSKG